MSTFDPAGDDALLMSWIAVGNDEAVEPLIRRYEKALLSVLSEATRDRALADDLFQETWIRVVRSASRFDPAQPFKPWLFKIAWNLVRTAMGRVSRERSTPIEDAKLAVSPSAADEVQRRDEERHTRELINALPPKLAEAVFLKYFEDLTEKEVAERLGIPVGTVKSRLHNALRQLGVALKEN